MNKKDLSVPCDNIEKQSAKPNKININPKKNELLLDTFSVERIYQHIWADKKANGTLYLHFRR